MKKEFRSAPNFSEQKHVNVDRENSTIKNIEIAKYGRNKNLTFFDDKFLDDLVKKGNEQKQGVKSRFGHPNMCASSLGTFVGRYKNFRVENRKAYADLTLDPITKKTSVEGKGIKMYDYIMDMAESNSDMFGNSIVIMGDEYENEIENEKGEKEWENVQVLHSLLASDLVDDPAATDALFSVGNDFGVTITQFLDANPKIYEIANEKPELFMDFLERYEAYHNRKSNNNPNMSFLDKLKKKFSTKEDDKKFDVDLTLATGDMIKVVTENETPQEGDGPVQDADGSVLSDEELLLQDGRTIVTDESGMITEIREPEEDGGDEGEGEEGQNSGEGQGENNFDTLMKEIKSFKAEFSETMGIVTQQFSAHEKSIGNLQKTVKTQKYNAPKKGERKGITDTGEDSFEAKIEKQRAEREAKNKKK